MNNVEKTSGPRIAAFLTKNCRKCKMQFVSLVLLIDYECPAAFMSHAAI